MGGSAWWKRTNESGNTPKKTAGPGSQSGLDATALGMKGLGIPVTPESYAAVAFGPDQPTPEDNSLTTETLRIQDQNKRRKR